MSDLGDLREASDRQLRAWRRRLAAAVERPEATLRGGAGASGAALLEQRLSLPAR
jgi:tryptophan 2,3-dioxygenase